LKYCLSVARLAEDAAATSVVGAAAEVFFLRRQIAVFRLECTNSGDSLEALEEKRPSKQELLSPCLPV
jgi:hypothetical protein